jgi:hypothetical protein
VLNWWTGFGKSPNACPNQIQSGCLRLRIFDNPLNSLDHDLAIVCGFAITEPPHAVMIFAAKTWQVDGLTIDIEAEAVAV